jgi:hypothetical protein
MPIIGTIASSTRQGLVTDTGAMFPIGSVYVSTATSTITFSNIPSTYQHLQIRGMSRGTVAQNEMQTFYQFNGDTAGNYSWHIMRGDGSSALTAGSAGDSSATAQARQAAANAAANTFGVFVTDIYDYKTTSKYKTARTISGVDLNGSGQVYYTTGAWKNNSAITSILIGINDGGNFAVGSQFTLYGIKVA